MNTATGARVTRRVGASLLVLLAVARPESALAGQTRQAAVQPGVGAARDEQADAELVNSALMGADDEAREDAVGRLPELPTSMALFALQQAMLDGRPRVRSAALDALADIGGDAVVAMLAAALVDLVPGVREDAVYAIGRVSGPLAQEALAMALGDPDPSVREAALLVSKELASRRVPRPVRPRRRP